MAFRRNFPGKRRKTFTKGFKRPVARQRRTWVTSINADICNSQTLAGAGCGGTDPEGLFQIILVNNSVLEDKFSDRATFARLVGDLWFQPTWDATSDASCSDSLIQAAAAYVQLFIGLRRYNINNAGAFLVVDPFASDFDLSESEWLRTWQHTWVPQASLEFVGSHTVKGCGVTTCSDVHTEGVTDNIFVDGSGTINIGTTCTDPVTVECDSVQDDQCVYHVDFPRVWHLHFDLKKRVPLREDEELALYCQQRMANAGAPNISAPRIQWWGNLRSLITY